MTNLRPCVAALVLAGGIFATHSFRPKDVAGRERPLREFPSEIGFSHSEDRPFENEVVRAIGADDYLNRVYLGGAPPIELYIGYYKDQRSGDRIHSPKNCLPGSGWAPVHSTRVQIGSVDGVPVVVNGYLVAQGPRREMVLYWYHRERIPGKVLAGCRRVEARNYRWRNRSHLDQRSGRGSDLASACRGVCAPNLSAGGPISTRLTGKSGWIPLAV
jgi:hypothetical protein